MDKLLEKFGFKKQEDGSLVSDSYNNTYTIQKTGDHYTCESLGRCDSEGFENTGKTPAEAFMNRIHEMLED